MTLPNTFLMLFLMISFDSGMGAHLNNTLTRSSSYKHTLYTESHFFNILESFNVFSLLQVTSIDLLQISATLISSRYQNLAYLVQSRHDCLNFILYSGLNS